MSRYLRKELETYRKGKFLNKYGYKRVYAEFERDYGMFHLFEFSLYKYRVSCKNQARAITFYNG